jgi:hypothetical protein
MHRSHSYGYYREKNCHIKIGKSDFYFVATQELHNKKD